MPQRVPSQLSVEMSVWIDEEQGCEQAVDVSSPLDIAVKPTIDDLVGHDFNIGVNTPQPATTRISPTL